MLPSLNLKRPSVKLEQTYPIETWRVIVPNGPLDGALNMAVDEAISEAVGRGNVPPTLRFYTWEPACLSLGYGQRARTVDFERLADFGWDAVRRSTGGQAILHTDELTYSICVRSENLRVEGDIVESYWRLSRGLVAGIEALGAAVQSDPKDPNLPKDTGPVCFEVPSDYEITAKGRKLIGSAQRRRGDTVLQHGTLPLFGDISRICDVLVFDSDAARESARIQVSERAITLEDALDEFVSFDDAMNALAWGFRETLNLDYVYEPLTNREWQRAEELCEMRYGTDEWTMRRP